MRASALRLLAALLSLTLFAAACGDDDETTEAASGDGEMADEMADDEMGHDDDGHHAHDGDPDSPMMEGGGHEHAEPVEFEGDDVPTVAVEVVSDTAGGVNVLVATTNYDIAPEAASTEHVEGEGHFHLYIDGMKVMRFYNEAVYVAGVTEGDIDVMVELSANDHRPYAVDGEPIVAMTTFTVPAHDHDEHQHGDDATVEWEGDAPELAIEVVEDPKKGHNAMITVSGMELTADGVGGENVAGAGHLHIYANGQKIGRLYGTATHIPALPEGEVEITIGAYANDHSAYVIDGEPIEASTTITVAS